MAWPVATPTASFQLCSSGVHASAQVIYPLVQAYRTFTGGKAWKPLARLLQTNDRVGKLNRPLTTSKLSRWQPATHGMRFHFVEHVSYPFLAGHPFHTRHQHRPAPARLLLTPSCPAARAAGGLQQSHSSLPAHAPRQLPSGCLSPRVCAALQQLYAGPAQLLKPEQAPAQGASPHRIRCVRQPTAAVACRDMRMRFSKRLASRCCTCHAACWRCGRAPTPFAKTSPAPTARALPCRSRARRARMAPERAASLALRPKVLLCVEAVQAVRHVVPEPDARDGALAEVRRVQDLHGAERASVAPRMRAWLAPQVQCQLAMLHGRDPGRRASLTRTRQVEPTSFKE